MFCDKLNDILSALDLQNNSEIGRLIGCHPSYISRIRKGDRAPSPSSRGVIKLVQGLCAQAERSGKLDELARVVGVTPGGQGTDWSLAMTQYLYEGESKYPVIKPKGRNPLPTEEKSLFASKLTMVMEAAGLSSARLARFLNVDSAIISRYRNGKRSPHSKRYFVSSLCETLYEYMENHEKLPVLNKLIGLEEDRIVSEQRFSNWMCGEPSSTELDGGFGQIPSEEFHILSLEDAVEDDILNDTSDVYIGTDGLRNAVLRFLATAARTGGGEMLLYSDLDMGWMTGSKKFFQQWLSLMVCCLQNDVRIKIIHNIDRKMMEMGHAMASWLPLYMSGKIQSYYNPKQKGHRFCNTLFLYRNPPPLYTYTGYVYKRRLPQRGRKLCPICVPHRAGVHRLLRRILLQPA